MVGKSCCVIGCNSHSHDQRSKKKIDNGISFYSFPAWRRNEGSQMAAITRRRRRAWVSAVRRSSITFSNISASMKVCSLHFHSGKPAYEMLETHPDWAPSLRLGHEATETEHFARRSKREGSPNMTAPGEDESTCPTTHRRRSKKMRRDPGTLLKITKDTKACSGQFSRNALLKTLAGLWKLNQGAVPSLFARTVPESGRTVLVRYNSPETIAAEEAVEGDANSHNLSLQEMPPPHPDHDYTQVSLSVEEQLEEAISTIGDQSKLIARLQEEFSLVQFHENDKNIMFFTGFQDYSTLRAVFRALQPTAENMARWSETQQAPEDILLQGFLVPKLTLFDQFLLFLCRLRQGFPEQDLAICFNVSLSAVSKICVTWTSFLYFLLGSLPIWLSRQAVNELMPACFQNSFPRTRVILHCTEIHIQRPCSKVLIHNKGKSTFKALVGIAPSGEVTFVSDLYTGSVSEEEIIRESGILDLLEEGDEVMADEGFLIEDILTEKKVSIVVPPSLNPRPHVSPEEARHAQTIARLGIVVERAIRRVREYHIFDGILPATLVGSVQQLWTVCALLSNFQCPAFE